MSARMSCGSLLESWWLMKDILVSILIVAGTLLVCSAYFKYVIRAWLSRDPELAALNAPAGVAPTAPDHAAPCH